MMAEVDTMSEEASMHKPRFVWSFDFGQILNIVSLILTVSGALWYQASTHAAAQAEMRRDILNLQANAAMYFPRVEIQAQSDNVQNERIGNLSDAVRDIRKTNSEILTQMGGVREDLAGIKGRLIQK